jgi:hypothetical protein
MNLKTQDKYGLASGKSTPGPRRTVKAVDFGPGTGNILSDPKRMFAGNLRAGGGLDLQHSWKEQTTNA